MSPVTLELEVDLGARSMAASLPAPPDCHIYRTTYSKKQRRAGTRPTIANHELRARLNSTTAPARSLRPKNQGGI